MRFSILLTSAGKRVELLRAFREAAESLGPPCRIIATDIDSCAPALHEADRSYIVPTLDSEDYIPQLQRIITEEQVDLVFPLIDPDIPVLATHRHDLESSGSKIVVLPIDSVRVTADKWRTYQFFRDLGVPCAESWLPDDIDVDQFSFPLFAKPRFGSASGYTYAIRDKKELSFFLDYIPRPIVQTMLCGPEITTDVMSDLEGNVLSVVSRERIRVQGGEVMIGKTICDARIQDACVEIAERLHAIGPITVQCIMHDERPIFTEVNARFGGGVVLGIAAGANGPQYLLASMLGQQGLVPPIGTYKQGLYMSRYTQAMYFDDSTRQRFMEGVPPEEDSQCGNTLRSNSSASSFAKDTEGLPAVE